MSLAYDFDSWIRADNNTPPEGLYLAILTSQRIDLFCYGHYNYRGQDRFGWFDETDDSHVPVKVLVYHAENFDINHMRPLRDHLFGK